MTAPADRELNVEKLVTTLPKSSLKDGEHDQGESA